MTVSSFHSPHPVQIEGMATIWLISQLILQVKPGITGLWHVSGQNRLSMDERLALDLYYVKNNSLQLDLYILLKTFLSILSKNQSYIPSSYE